MFDSKRRIWLDLSKMLGYSRTAGYAIHALGCIGASLPNASQIGDIAKATGLKKPYLAQIISQLGRRGLVESRRGHRGGVLLTRTPEAISLYEIVEAVDIDTRTSPCLFGLERCPTRGRCPAHSQWSALRKELEDMLRNTSLSEVIKAVPTKGNGGLPRRSNGKRPAGATGGTGRAGTRSVGWRTRTLAT